LSFLEECVRDPGLKLAVVPHLDFPSVVRVEAMPEVEFASHSSLVGWNRGIYVGREAMG
jgi:hypothetical protein